MSKENAAALVAKLSTDTALAQQLNTAKSEAEFLQEVKKLGFDVTVAEFKTALDDFKKSPAAKELSDAKLDQVSAGLSIVGADYAFVAVQTTS